MTNVTYQWKSHEGEILFGQTWSPDQTPKAVINFVHGIGEHSDRYQDWMPFFVNEGYAVAAIEYRGHGRSFGKRGLINSYEDLMKDIDVLFAESDKLYPGLPVFLYGHSLGGNLVINYTLRRNPKINALVATSPWLLLSTAPPAWQISAVKWIRSIWPSLIIKTNIKTDQITQNKAITEAYSSDPMVHNRISVELFVSAYENGQWAIDHAKEMPVPFYLTHGAGDPITSPKGSDAFYRNNPDKVKFKIWDGMLHELHNEPIRTEHAKGIIEWLNQHI
jgi:alpha-beta hydrolase superfamily lysophospholipase